ncbi:hypothetical protein [Acidaminococcus sp.]|uniref:hypothetical protein n=1 Tax=Acidaminococcus sp. TaxID=1872103 RepID=UPI00352238C4
MTNDKFRRKLFEAMCLMMQDVETHELKWHEPVRSYMSRYQHRVKRFYENKKWHLCSKEV